jgi:hypothetical protein
MSEDIYKMFGSQYSKKVSLLSQQGIGYGKKKSSGSKQTSKDKKKKTR